MFRNGFTSAPRIIDYLALTSECSVTQFRPKTSMRAGFCLAFSGREVRLSAPWRPLRAARAQESATQMLYKHVEVTSIFLASAQILCDMCSTREPRASRLASSVVKLALTPVASLYLDLFPRQWLSAATFLGGLFLNRGPTWRCTHLSMALLLKTLDSRSKAWLLLLYRFTLYNIYCWWEHSVCWACFSFLVPFFVSCQGATTDDTFINDIAESEKCLLRYLALRFLIWLCIHASVLRLGDWLIILVLIAGPIYGWMSASEEGRVGLTIQVWKRWGELRPYWPRFLLLSLRNRWLARIEQWEQSNTIPSQKNDDSLGPYEYTSLASGGPHIRLLKIHRTAPLAELQCSLESFSFTKTKPYTALSYCWGKNATADVPLEIDGRRMLVGKTVWDFIWQQRSWLRATYVWIDAICIDQSNKDEKSIQVRLMQDIYAKSTRVVGWLSSSPNDQDFLSLWPVLRIAMQERDEPTTRNSFKALIVDSQTSGLAGGLDKTLCCLRDLLNNQYFERVWIVQEVVMGSTVHIRYGDMCFTWEVIAAVAMLVLTNRQLYGSLHAIGEPSSSLREGQETGRRAFNILAVSDIRATKRLDAPGNQHSVSRLLALTSEGFMATDPRDKVFALFGLAKNFSNFAQTVNYRLTVEEVFLETARLIVRTEGWPLMLRFAGRGYDLTDLADSEVQGFLPSWVPNWGCRKRGLVAPYDWSPGVGQTPTLLGHSLVLRSHRICTIQHLGPKTTFLNDLDIPLPEIGHTYPIQSGVGSWYRMSRQLARTHSSPRNNEDAIDGEFWRLCMATSKNREEGYLSEARRVFESFLFSQTIEENGSAEEILQRRQELHNLPHLMNGGFAGTVTGKRLAISECGRMALVPPGTQQGDQIHWVFGALSPLVLRQKGNGSYELIGSCHLQGEEFISHQSIPQGSLIRLE